MSFEKVSPYDKDHSVWDHGQLPYWDHDRMWLFLSIGDPLKRGFRAPLKGVGVDITGQACS